MDSNPNHESKFVVGISPQYWAYTPMSVMDVLNLKLKDGINWLEPGSTKKIDGKKEFLSTPVSKCLLVGQIVYAADRKGSRVYILDDGTGVIDCVHWSNDEEDPYHLPSLTDPKDDQDRYRGFDVGESVRVFGKIDCLASIPRPSRAATTGIENKRENSDNNTNSLVREIQIRIIERLEDPLVSEAQHWMDTCRRVPIPLRTHLENLGPDIGGQIQNRVDLPSAEDASNAWRVFGTNCNCKLPFMEELLYCHCQCTAEPLDPFYRFRDALLDTLLSLQHKTTGKLEFHYKEVRNNRHLQSVAQKEVTNENHRKEKQEKIVDRLFLKTFSALRNDGILYLVNSNTDNYLLITRKEVLEPIAQAGIGNKQNPISYGKLPRYVSKVHYERIRYIRRLLEEEPANFAQPSNGEQTIHACD